MVLAIASASISYRYGDASYRKALSLVVCALQYAEDVLHPGSITGIQAILLLAQYSLVDPKHFHSWYLVGMAVRVMVDLGLHHDIPSEVVTDTDRLDIRRRVFHSIYCLDRSVYLLMSLDDTGELGSDILAKDPSALLCTTPSRFRMARLMSHCLHLALPRL